MPPVKTITSAPPSSTKYAPKIMPNARHVNLERQFRPGVAFFGRFGDVAQVGAHAA